MASKVGWDLEFLQEKGEGGDSVRKKTAAGEDGDSGMGRVGGTSKYGKLHYRVTHTPLYLHQNYWVTHHYFSSIAYQPSQATRNIGKNFVDYREIFKL